MTAFLVDRTAMADLAQAAAESAGVCVRPVVRQVIDRATGQSQLVPIPCGSTREAVCPTCATKARRLRMYQCREGWHREDEPESPPADDGAGIDSESLSGHESGDETAIPLDAQLAETESEDDDAPVSGHVDAETPARRTRSTRRIDGFPDLPRIPMSDATVGRAFTDERTGKRYRPSMFITLTLPSYGRIHDGVPVNPGVYDYRRAALDALTFSRLVDRFWQNLRRCAGYKVQYFSAVEAQRRLAPHLHAAVRGAIPRSTVKAVAAATYFAAWWPSVDEVVYANEPPVWDPAAARYLDPETGAPLPSWDEATRYLDEPLHVVTLGSQVDVKGILGGTDDSDRTVRYLCKYLTKSIADTYTGDAPDLAYERHIDRLYAEVRWLPCGPACANWLRYGVEPKTPRPGLIPGRCPSPAHDRENLGIGGRRVLVSRQWSGKTLTEHRADRAAVVRETLDAAGYESTDVDRLAASHTLPDGTPRFEWRDPDPIHLDYTAVIAASLRQTVTWRRQYETAKQQASGAGPPGTRPVDNRSAIDERDGEG